MKKIKLLVVALLVLVITGCAGSQDSERDALRTQLEMAQQDLIKFDKKIQSLEEEVSSLQASLEDSLNGESITFKDTISMNVTVLNKQKGTDLYPYFIIVSHPDVDHNTPLLLTTDNPATYNKIEVDEEYTFDVYVINVIEDNKSHVRYSFIID